MKTLTRISALLILPAMLFSCKDKIEEFITVNEPVYLSYEALRNSLKVAESRDIVQPGKIYFYNEYIFVNEYQRGIHIINNSNPGSPEKVKFIEIPGNVDMAVKDDILYADSYVDLVALDISNLNDIKTVKRITDAFPYLIPFCENGVIKDLNEEKGVVVGWKTSERKIEMDDNYNPYVDYMIYRDQGIIMLEYANTADGAGKSNSGTGGSMARFTVYNDYLYAVDKQMLRLFNITNASDPKIEKEVYAGWNIETLFPYDQKLFLGSTTGMYIYSLANPSDPTYISTFWHVTGCDPVVVEGKYAYVTLRAGNLCGNNLSGLNVIDISTITAPVLLKEYPMQEPYGLGINKNLLFICDGDAGLKIFNAADPMTIDKHKVAQYPDMNAWDVIVLEDILIMTGSDGLYQYNYSNPEHIYELSVIPIESLTGVHTEQ